MDVRQRRVAALLVSISFVTRLAAHHHFSPDQIQEAELERGGRVALRSEPPAAPPQSLLTCFLLRLKDFVHSDLQEK